MKALGRFVGVIAGYAVIAGIGLFFLGAAGVQLQRVPPDETGTVSVAGLVAFLSGAGFAVAAVMYELRGLGRERLDRHSRMQWVSIALLAISLGVWLLWALLPAVVRVASLAAAGGFFLGFLAIFAPNRHRSIKHWEEANRDPDR